ncbi:50S ribosomal protein L6 [Nanoarchaeota archaeon]
MAEKKKQRVIKQSILLTEGVKAEITNGLIKITGEKGNLERDFTIPNIKVTQEENNVVVTSSTNATQREKKMIGTIKSHIQNMISGVSEGHVYKLKICSGHFPMNVSVSGSKLEIKNFIGEADSRRLDIKQGADVKVEGDIITVESLNKETAGQVAADIERLTKRPGFDTRIFQDGIYIIEKDGKTV